MRVTTTKSKNSESFYITKSFKNSKGKSTSTTVRKLGVLNELLKEHGPTRDDVMAWAREEARLETVWRGAAESVPVFAYSAPFHTQ